MLQIEPQKDFIIARQLDDPVDTDTYYIQAYVREGSDDTLLETIDLTDKGSQRFRGTWHSVADVSGEGRYITVTTKVFTDSAYTTASDNYGLEENLLLVKKGYSPVFGGGGARDINYKKLRKIIKEEMAKLPKPKLRKKLDLTPILKAISGIDIPAAEKANLGPVLDEIRALQDQIRGIRIPIPEKPDLQPVMKAIEDVNLKETKTAIESIFEKIKEYILKDMEDIRGVTEDIKKRLGKIPFLPYVTFDSNKLKSQDEKDEEKSATKKTYRKYL